MHGQQNVKLNNNALFAIKVQVFCNYYLDPSCQLCVFLLAILTSDDNLDPCHKLCTSAGFGWQLKKKKF
jgi:hypothetical protein